MLNWPPLLRSVRRQRGRRLSRGFAPADRCHRVGRVSGAFQSILSFRREPLMHRGPPRSEEPRNRLCDALVKRLAARDVFHGVDACQLR